MKDLGDSIAYRFFGSRLCGVQVISADCEQQRDGMFYLIYMNSNFHAGVSCGLFVIAFAWAVVTGACCINFSTKGHIRRFIADRIADGGDLLEIEMKVCYRRTRYYQVNIMQKGCYGILQKQRWISNTMNTNWRHIKGEFFENTLQNTSVSNKYYVFGIYEMNNY